VSSDFWRGRGAARTVCIKRALPTLKVAAEWHAPISRNAYEWEWLQFASRHAPDAAPRPLAHDAQAGLFAMAYLAPQDHPLWKAQLLAGVVTVETAAAVGATLARLHRASAADAALVERFDSTDNFHALRLEPYLLATGRRHPGLAARLDELVETTMATRRALVHGDVSPKNILVGARSPVFLDAECAWFGDPAFDLAFCLNHLLLKCLVHPGRRGRYLAAFGALAAQYLDGVDWEPRAGIEARTAALLPALLLARIDGKSPVEYVREDWQREAVRANAGGWILRPAGTLDRLAAAWDAVIGAAPPRGL
jgi:5-methylthioribose kinase